eukprot:TRINITY_DN7568_c0_g1_i1.p1 TRINITY_DN7568_c0_g1~~TRINITY_DN7568_c0_g1_i1.p1  ORF type:complete len:286 (-),score=34.91 TRINITY_DN7568_c0_g1_i1:6-863(-)
MEDPLLQRIEWSDIQHSAEKLVNSIKRYGFAILRLTDPTDVQVIKQAFAEATRFFGESDSVKKSSHISSKVGYKKNRPKERYQFRRCTGNYPMPDEKFKESMFSTYNLFERISVACMEIILQDVSISPRQVLEHYLDDLIDFMPPSTSPLDKNSNYGTSVFNLYHYFNTNETVSAENCAEHTDPGLITVLGKGTSFGLEVTDLKSGSYLGVEQFMEDGRDLLVLPGETLQRLTGGKVRGNLHRVVKNGQSRINMAYEMRPKAPIYYPWDSEEEKKARPPPFGNKT